MTGIQLQIILWGITCLACFSSCNIDGELEECSYNAHLEYWYTVGGKANVLPEYIHRMDEFVFDAEGILRQVNNRVGKKNIASELNVLPGDYTLVTWANIGNESRINDMRVGYTRLEEMQLYLDNPVKSYAAINVEQGCSEPLYYGYRKFTVGDKGVSRGRIDMTHGYLSLRVTVKWKRLPPADTGNFRLTLRGVPAVYTFRPEGELTRQQTVNYFPGIGTLRVDHNIPATMGMSRAVTGTFTTYRLTDTCHPLLRLYAGDTPLMKEIDLYTYFRTMQVGLDRNIRQEFDLVLEIDGGTVLVSNAVVSDWENGGTIGGGRF